ncbi:DUF6941 family protein [Pelolinea submarina]|uniref:Uncharacterized protein n=1 Tax=Pelolinea submarina TaxID=913107 RepID=A0A347ZR93_9CHLR|nr:hypothetical protein [Pelolinea submarina]REG11622.1 hypothetical protein DFR64_1514 [Pelolinea submarina]BBB47824.1 hypothetical protein Pelsub_P1051 [Pelolinea submarina]
MPVIRWAFLCDYACVDAAGKASIIGTFEYINVSKLPQRWPQLYVALEMQTTGEEAFELSAQINSPSGKEASKRIVIPFKTRPGDQQAHKGFVTFAFFSTLLEEEGEYHIMLFLDGTPIHFIPLYIRHKPVAMNPSLVKPTPNQTQ